METRRAAIHRKMQTPLRQLPITGSAHKAAVVRDDRMRARLVLAARNMTAERRRAAALDCAHHLHLTEAHMAGVGATPCGAEVAEDVRDFESGTRHEA